MSIIIIIIVIVVMTATRTFVKGCTIAAARTAK